MWVISPVLKPQFYMNTWTLGHTYHVSFLSLVTELLLGGLGVLCVCWCVVYHMHICTSHSHEVSLLKYR